MRPAHFGRAAAITALLALAYAALAAAMALDRASRRQPEYGARVPAALRHEGLAAAAQTLTLTGRPAEALIPAQLLVRRDPLAPHAAGLLGTARLARGDGAGAAQAFRASARLGWRDAATQVYWFDAAIRRGDYPLAVTRFVAIARQWPGARAIDDLSARLEADPRGARLLAMQLASGPRWAKAYASQFASQSLERMAGRARILNMAAAMGGRLGCDAALPLVSALAERQARLASEVWAGHCPRAPAPGQLADGGFESQPATGPATAFDWQFPGNGALDSAVIGPPGSRALRVVSGSAALLPVAAQRIVLPAGRYRISWTESGSGQSRLAASLSCRAERAVANPQDGSGSGGRKIALAEVDGQCEAPLLQLWLRPGSGPVTIDDVTIGPA